MTLIKSKYNRGTVSTPLHQQVPLDPSPSPAFAAFNTNTQVHVTNFVMSLEVCDDETLL